MDERSDGIETVGARLAHLRVAQSLELSDIAARTRIPLRHLKAVEASDYAALPSETYALGFVRSYARSLGVDEVELAAQLRAELGRAPLPLPGRQVYEPVNPARLPSKLLAWTAALLAILVVGGYGLWRSYWLGGGDAVAITRVGPSPVKTTASPVAPPAGTVATGGEVVITASAAAWVKISDGANVLAMRELAQGERFVVPANAADPRIVTGRPEALSVTVGGKPVAPLGPPAKTVKNASLKAAALSAMPVAPAAAAGDNGSVPSQPE